MTVLERVCGMASSGGALDAILSLEPEHARRLFVSGFAAGAVMGAIGVASGAVSVNAALVYLAVAMLPTTIAGITAGNAAVWAFVFPFQAVSMFGASIGLLIASVPLGSTAVTAMVSLLVLVTGIPAFMFLFYIITSRNVGGRGSVGGRRGSR